MSNEISQSVSDDLRGYMNIKTTYDSLNSSLGDIANFLSINAKSNSYTGKAIKGDGVTDDTVAIQSLFNSVPDRCIIEFPLGTYKISAKLTVPYENIVIKGAGCFNASNSRWFWNWHDNENANLTEFKFDTAKSNTDMIEFLAPVSFTYGSSDRKYQGVFDISFHGNDGTVQIFDANRVSRAADYQTIFTGTNVNGIILNELTIMQNVSVRGFSGKGIWNKGYWSRFSNIFTMLCGLGLHVDATDTYVGTFFANGCKNGIQIGSDTTSANMTFISNIRIELCQEYGINIYNSAICRVQGFIDRCTYAGVVAGLSHNCYSLDIDMDIQRCGCWMKGVTYSSFTTGEKQLGVNIYLNNVTGFKISGLQIKNQYDDNVPNGYTAYQVPECGITTNNSFQGVNNVNFVSFATADKLYDFTASNSVTLYSNRKTMFIDDFGNSGYSYNPNTGVYLLGSNTHTQFQGTYANAIQLFGYYMWVDTTGNLRLNQAQPANDTDGVSVSKDKSGTTAQRPTTGLYVGYRYFDTTLNYPIYYAGSSVWKRYTDNTAV